MSNKEEPMKIYLDDLIGGGDDEQGVPVQIIFKLGVQPHAGMLRRARVPGTKNGTYDGMYELCMMTQPAANAPKELKQQEHILVTLVFEPSAVMLVVREMGESSLTSRIVKPH